MHSRGQLVYLIQDTRCGHARLTQIRHVPYGPGEHSGLFPGRSPVCRADGHSCVTLAYALFCSGWPSPVPARVNATAVVNLCHTLSLSPSHPMLFASHTHKQHALSLWRCISSSVNSEKNKPPSESSIWPPFLMEHISWGLTDTVTQKANWLECFAPLFKLWVEIFAKYNKWDFYFVQFSVLHCWYFFWGWHGSCLCQLWIPRTIGRWIRQRRESQNSFIYACRSVKNKFLFTSITLEEWIFLMSGKGEERKNDDQANKNTHFGTILDSDKQQHKYQNKCRLAA